MNVITASAAVHNKTLLLHCEEVAVGVGEETVSLYSVNSATLMTHC
jgi:hypothetical protein